ncbi:MAG TPA: lysophospholipid acyltransferase family protein [Candidatus Methylomirabilis sp.]|nr:lysophospholipid acyltransferase family protein [Candidatus Methylomirabilis sp.]
MVWSRALSWSIRDSTAAALSHGRFLLVRLLLLPALAFLPVRLAFGAARWRGRRRFQRLGPEVRGRMRRDLRLVSKPSEEAEIDAILEESMEVTSCDELDLFFYARFGRRGFSRIVQVEGLKHLDVALEDGRGAILFSAHFGGAQGFLGALAARGYRLFGIVRSFDRDPWVQRLAFRWKTWLLERVQNGPLLFAGQGAVGEALRCLQEGRVGWVIIDAPPGKTRRVVEVEFLGQPCRLSYGLIELAEATRAPVLPFFVFYTAPHLRRAVIGPPVKFSPDGEPKTTRRKNLRRCLEPIEEAISQAPSHWMMWGNFESLWSPDTEGAEAPTPQERRR